MSLLIRDDVVLLNRRATNLTRARVEDGVDWDHWRFYPATDGREGEFSDGHDYAGYPCAPLSGWVLDKETIALPADAVLVVLRGLDEAHVGTEAIARPARRVDREAAAMRARDALRTLHAAFAAAVREAP